MIGEIIASESKSFKAQVALGSDVPAFGEWVCVQHPDGSTTVGIVFSVQRESVEPGRQVEALGRTKEELEREMPHVFELIRTVFSCLVVGYQTKEGVFRQTIPPHPPELHAFVDLVEQTLIETIQPPYDFFRLLTGGTESGLPTDDLFVTILQKLSLTKILQRQRIEVLIEAGRTISRLLGDDHERLNAILRRISQ